MYRVGDIMSRNLVTLSEEEDLGLADAIMALGRIRHLPVVRDGKLVGLVTHRDLLRVWAEDSGPAARTQPASQRMTASVRTATPEMPVSVAARVMMQNKLGCLPVVEKDRRLVGIVTEADFLRFAAELAEAEESPVRVALDRHGNLVTKGP